MKPILPCPLCKGPMSIGFEVHAFDAGTSGAMEPHWHARRRTRCDACRYTERTRWSAGWPKGVPDQVRDVYGALAELSEGLDVLAPRTPYKVRS